jgi:hypothetical protein
VKHRKSNNSFEDEEEDVVDRDIEDIFLDAIGEIQEASVKLNYSLASARSLSLMKRGDTMNTPLETEKFEDAADYSIKETVQPDEESK